jgi:hypothetical protein
MDTRSPRLSAFCVLPAYQCTTTCRVCQLSISIPPQDDLKKNLDRRCYSPAYQDTGPASIAEGNSGK